MDIEIRETHGKRPWVWYLRDRAGVAVSGGWARTLEHAQKAARKAQRLRTHKNGNGHITFTRLDLVEKLNHILAIYYPFSIPDARRPKERG